METGRGNSRPLPSPSGRVLFAGLIKWIQDLITGFIYICDRSSETDKMNITLSIEEQIVKKVRKIAVDKDTTLTAMVRGVSDVRRQP